MAELKKGKDPECSMYSCPHKNELEAAMDEIAILSRKNEELNQRLESIDSLIEQGLVDIKGIIAELFKGNARIEPEKIKKITEEIEAVFNTQKITDIINENLRLRKEKHISEVKITELKQEIKIVMEEKQAMQDTLRLREEKDLNLIKGMRNIDKQAEEQLNSINSNNLSIKHQETKLKALEDFIKKAREDVKELKEEHIYLQKEIKAYKTKGLTKEARKVMSLIKKVKRIKNSKFKLFGNNNYKLQVKYVELKEAYFALADYEKQKIVEQYDEAARLMGE